MIGIKPSEVKTIGVIGTGIIGSSWATLFLAQGRDVTAWDPKTNAQSDLYDFVNNAWPTLKELGTVVETASPDRITFCNNPESAVEQADFVQESGPERLDIKRKLYKSIASAIGDQVVISTSTSGLLISDLQKGQSYPQRFVLGHPFNPPHLIPLVEVLGGRETDPNVVDWTIKFYNEIGKKAVKLNKEIPGHIANRLQAAIWRETIYLALEGVASIEDIDAAISYGPGLRWALMGPNLTFHLAGGEGGMANFVETFGPSISHWWNNLGHPDLTEETKFTLINGVNHQVGKKTIRDLVKLRDKRLLALLKALHESEATI